MATATPPGSGTTDGSHAQFWDDFWNTLYQFTHPFSSTFFDTVFSDESSSSKQQQQQQPPTADKLADAASSSSSRYFKDEASFQKFWQGLQNGSPDGTGTGSGSPLDHLQTAWVDFKSASSGFIQAVSF